MPSIGERLRLERERQGRSISDIATYTCIIPRYLTAIEQDDHKALPGNFFYRNFVKQYASALGLSSDPLIRELDSILPKNEKDVLPALIGSYAPAGRTRARNRSRALVSLVLLVGSLAGGSALYAWWEKTQRKEPAAMVPTAIVQAASPEPQPSQRSEPSKTTVPVEPAASAAPAPTAPEPVPTAPQASSPVQTPAVGGPAAPPGGDAGTVRLAATERTWVSVSANGKPVFSGILEPAQTRLFEGLKKAKLVAGNAAGLEVEWNGKTIGPIGPRGQVRLVLLNGESYQIVSPAPTRGM